MINRHFENLKYTRTYIGGSKKKEDERFENYDKQDGENELNWIDYRKTWIEYYDDLLNVIFSWKLLFQKVSYILGVLGLIQLFLNTFIGGAIVALSILTHIIFLIFKKKQSQELNDYDFTLSIIHGEIKRIYNLDMDINPQK